MKICVVLVTWFGVVSARNNASFADYFTNLLNVDLLINFINNQQELWQAGRNFSPNTTITELMDLLGAEMTAGSLLFIRKIKDPKWPATRDLPEFFDAREKWSNCSVIAEVLDQSQCGSCWVMSPAQVATDRYCIASNGYHDIRLSGQEILACETFHFLKGCHGGNPADAYKFILRNGLVSGGAHDSKIGCQPYFMPMCAHHGNGPFTPCNKTEVKLPVCNLTCTNEEYKVNFKDDIRRFSHVYKLGSNEKHIMKDIMTYGSVSTQFQVHGDFFFYKSGVYEPITPRVFNRQNGRMLGHTLKLFGWGTENGVPYWLGMNTWNKYWGDQGTIKIRRRSSQMQLESMVYSAIPKVDPKFYKPVYRNPHRN